MTNVIVIVEGGVVQEIISDDKIIATVLDRDTDGLDEYTTHVVESKTCSVNENHVDAHYDATRVKRILDDVNFSLEGLKLKHEIEKTGNPAIVELWRHLPQDITKTISAIINTFLEADIGYSAENINFKPNQVKGSQKEPWFWFKPGTKYSDILDWFDNNHSEGVCYLIDNL